MQVYKIPPQGFSANTYAVTQDNADCILVDCAHEGVIMECEKLALTPRAVLLTHGHFDHIAGLHAIDKGVDVYCGEGEDGYIFSRENASIFGLPIPEFNVKRTLKDGETFSVCGLDIRVISTPGHTAGSVCYIIGDTLFSGDTLFCGSVGRWDLPGGDFRALSASLKKLKALQGEYIIRCGHGEDTSLTAEKLYNEFLR